MEFQNAFGFGTFVYFKSKTIDFMFSFTFLYCLDLSVIIICLKLLYGYFSSFLF